MGHEDTPRAGPDAEGIEDERRRQLLRTLGTIPIAASVAGCSSGGDGGDGDGGSGGGGGGGGSGDGPDLAGRGPDEYGDVVDITIDAPVLMNLPDIQREIGNTWERELGVQFEVVTTSWGTYLSKIWVEQNYDHMAWTFFGGSPERVDPSYYLSIPTEGRVQNVSNFSDPEYQEMYEEYTNTYDSEERDRIVGEMQQYWHENIVSPINTCWPVIQQPHNSAKWDIQKTAFIGAHTAATMSIISAEPKTDDTTLTLGGQEVNQRPNVTAPTANAMDWLFRSIYDTPRRMTFDGEFENWALDSVDRIDDTTIDLTLREGQQFHDGEDLTAEDLKFTFEFLSNHTFGKIDAHVDPVESVDTQTDLTARVNLERPWSTFLTSSLVYTWILPKHIWESVPDEVEEPVNWKQEVGDDPPGEYAASGPFQVVEVSPDYIELEAYDDHFSEYPNYDKLVYERLGSTEAIRSNLVEGNVDLPVAPSTPSVAQQTVEQSQDLELIESNAVRTFCYSFNTNNPPGDDLTFRKAARATTPSQKIIDVYRRGAGIPSDSTYVHPEHPWGLGQGDLPTMQEMYDPEGARQMLEDAGYAWDGQGRLHYPAD
jgi:peptide/nickel transport system substrate-binding protein